MYRWLRLVAIATRGRRHVRRSALLYAWAFAALVGLAGWASSARAETISVGEVTTLSACEVTAGAEKECTPSATLASTCYITVEGTEAGAVTLNVSVGGKQVIVWSWTPKTASETRTVTVKVGANAKLSLQPSAKLKSALNGTKCQTESFTTTAGAEGKEGKEGREGKAGEFLFRGAWSEATTYAKGDAATEGGSTYASLKAGNVAHKPSALGEWWALVAEKGAAGAEGKEGKGGSGGIELTRWEQAQKGSDYGLLMIVGAVVGTGLLGIAWKALRP